MVAFQPVRGTHDLIGTDMRRHAAVADVVRSISALYGFDEVITPIFEFTHVFTRAIGDATDIVSKEMYAFEKSGDHICLRPEGTAGLCRAFVSNRLEQHVPFRAFYVGPMFRYERPQKGRQRQFYQAGVELLGSDSPKADIEVLVLAAHILEACGVGDHVTLQLNTLGDTESRAAYRGALVEYFSRYRADLSEKSQERLQKNPLRILDSKERQDQSLIADAPSIDQYLNDESRTFFDAVRDGLENHGIPYTVNGRLVRGLDYYRHTVFEYVTEALGAQGAVLAGGRYDGLVEAMGGKPTPGVGWAAGVERLSLLVGHVPSPVRPVAVISIGAEAEQQAALLVRRLRYAGYRVDSAFSGTVKKRMKRANAVQARVALILGEDELAQGVVTIHDLDSGESRQVPLPDVQEELLRFYAEEALESA